MSERVSPFAALTGAEKQLKWLEYQSVRLPYIQGGMEEETAVPTPIPPVDPPASCKQSAEKAILAKPSAQQPERPQPPPEVPRMPSSMAEHQRSRHSQYDAVIARMKQAELQARVFKSMS